MKATIFKFVDGEREVQVGDKVYLASGQGRRGTSHETTIIEIGRKLIGIGSEEGGRIHSKFYIADGTQQTDYTKDYLYSSKAAFDEYSQRESEIASVYAWFRDNRYELTHEKAKKILQILSEED